MNSAPIKSKGYDCIVCGGRHKHHDGDVQVCVQTFEDPGGDKELNGKMVRYKSWGVCLSCLLSNEMDEIMAAYYKRFVRCTQVDPCIKLKIAEAKAKCDSRFCIEDYAAENGLEDLFDCKC